MANNITDGKLIHILSPLTGQPFKIELNGNEASLRDLLGTILEIPSSSIKGIKDSYNNYYTLSSALNSRNINNDPNNFYTVISENNINNNEYNIRKYSLNTNNYNINKEIYNNPNFYYLNNRYINDDNLLFYNNRINNIQNIQNFGISKIRNNYFGNNLLKNYSIKDYYYLINFLYKNNYIDNNNYYKLKKCIDINNQDVLDIMKPFIEFDDNYDKLINNLFPILNLDLTINDEFNKNTNNYFLKQDNYKHTLNGLKEYFTSDNIKELNYLLLMENIEIIKIFKIYYKTRNKKILISSLHDLLKKVSKINIRAKSKSNIGMNKIVKQRKSKSQNYTKFSKKSNNYANNIHNNKSNKNNKKDNKELLNEITNKILDYGKSFSKDIYYLMKYELKSLSDENKSTLFSSKFKININTSNIDPKNFSLNNTIKKNIKNYYNKYIQINVYKFLDDDEKKIYENIIEETNSQEFQELMEIYNEMLKNNKSKNKMELLRNKIINYIKQIIEQNNEEESEEEKPESKDNKNKDKSSNESKNSEEEDNIIKIEANEEEEEDEEKDEENKNEKNEDKESSFCSSTVMDVEEENNENYSEESGVSIRKANRPKKN